MENNSKPVGLRKKDALRIYYGPIFAKILRRFGFSWKQLGRTKLAQAVLIAQASQINKTILPKKNVQPLNIYFLTMLGGHSHNVSVDVVLGWGLKQLGHNVHFIVNNQILPITEETKNGEEGRWQELTAKSYAFAKKYLEAAGLNVLTVSQIVDQNKYRDIEEFEDIIQASILKHYKVGVITPDLRGIEEKKNQIRESVKISALIGDFLLQNNPDRVIMSHGIYSTWGPQFRVLDKNDVPIVTYSKTKRKKTEKFNWNHTGDWWDVAEEWERVREMPLTQNQEASIDKYLESRITHKDDVLVYNFGGLESKNETIDRFNLDKEKPIYSLFTNVLWDAASTQREIAFKDPVDWVFKTINWFSENPDKQLIVKIHPAEVVIGTNQPFADLIRATLKNIPDNVKIIEPQEKVNSWSIYSVTNLGLVHTTTVGMELPLVGIPCAVVSRTHYRDKGFTLDVNSDTEYFDLLANFNAASYDLEEMKLLAKRYAYLLFERYQMPFDVFDEPNWTDVRSFTFESINELFEKPYFSRIITSILNKEPFLTDPT